MRRREFIALAGVAASAWPLAVRAQQPAMPVVGFFRNTSLDDSAYLLAALRQGLNEAGFIEGQNVLIESRWSEYRDDRLPELAAELVRRQCAVIVAGGSVPTLAAKAATTTIPVVFASGDDPVKFGLVASLGRPGGNVTGVFFRSGSGTESKQLELLREVVPKAAAIGMLVNPGSPSTESASRDAQMAARALGQQLYIVEASNELELDAAFATLVQRRASALMIAGNALFTGRRDQLVALAARHALPTIFFLREFVAAGGLMSYGSSIRDAYRQVGVYTGRILKGAKPADLPVEQSAKFELVINPKTAQTLGLTIPPTLLARADEVIE